MFITFDARLNCWQKPLAIRVSEVEVTHIPITIYRREHLNLLCPPLHSIPAMKINHRLCGLCPYRGPKPEIYFHPLRFCVNLPVVVAYHETPGLLVFSGMILDLEICDIDYPRIITH